MGWVNLVTRNGSLSYNRDQHSFDVIDGGTLKITDQNGAGALIGPGFWVALVDAELYGPALDFELLALSRWPSETLPVNVEG